ncbi:hypothetical protein WA026_018245 [Henosepilachna vigintioctopunctata]|uniref:Dipeptidylpeptidase IV N-terminal domain-containing protein n=1 Tax=Henosepilachna vigintioctopunctata TaxID=420089 RepID=A0AAW1VBI0_9CUCU
MDRNDFPLRPLPEIDNHPYLLLARWAPKGQGIVMVQDYDIYYRKTPTSHSGYRITSTAVPGVVSHGVPDWLYEDDHRCFTTDKITFADFQSGLSYHRAGPRLPPPSATVAPNSVSCQTVLLPKHVSQILTPNPPIYVYAKTKPKKLPANDHSMRCYW